MELANTIKQTKRPFLIAGPCSAETEEQLFTIAQQLAATNRVHLLRAGIWKPRTRPDSFEGVGEIALPWLVNTGKQLGVPTTTEVANKKHVELALNAGVDCLWIGARTTVNPFAVQEIADALKGTKVPVLIKNPVNPDIDLWMGAFERFEKSGLTDLTAIHRGFSIYKHDKYRNVPSWELPIALSERLPEIPIICDPSHITGNRHLLLEVAQKAMDLNMDGLMVEVHPTPDQAWSDAAQQVDIEGFTAILDNLILRSKDIQNGALDELDKLRRITANLDDRIFQLLIERMQVSQEIGQFKRFHNMTILQQDRWSKIIASRLKTASDEGLSAQFIREIMDVIHQESIRHQEKIMNK